MLPLEQRVKYPKTMHFPWSPGLQNDDRVLQDPGCFVGKKVVITEKMDGENTTLYKDAIHARSIMDMASHGSRSWILSLHGRIKSNIPEGFRICGENLFAKHSIHYTREGGNALTSYFQVFSIWHYNYCLSWNDTEEWCQLLGLQTVPILHVGDYYDLSRTRPYIGKNSEGYVVRNYNGFLLEDFQTNVAKYVRKNHVQTSEHWLNQPVVRNELL